MSFLFLHNSLVIREKEESKGYKETKHAKIKNNNNNNNKNPIIWRVYSCNYRFEIHIFFLLPTNFQK